MPGVRPVHPAKAQLPIDVTPKGITMLVTEEQPANARSPIFSTTLVPSLEGIVSVPFTEVSTAATYAPPDTLCIVATPLDVAV